MATKKRSVEPDSIISGLLSGFGQVAEKSMENNYKVGQIQTRGGLQEQLAQNNYGRKLDYSELQRQNDLNGYKARNVVTDEDKTVAAQRAKEMEDIKQKNRMELAKAKGGKGGKGELW